MITNKIRLLIFGLAALLGGCVDSDYDLTRIDRDQITIGDATSEFRIPLVSVRIGMNELTGGEENLQTMCDEISTWLPSQLPDGDFADLQKIHNDATYLSGLVDALIAQIQTDDAKLNELSALVWHKYRSAYLESLGLPDDVTETRFHATLREALRSSDDLLRNQIRALIRSGAQGFLTGFGIKPLTYSVEQIDLSDEVIDMLSENLDPAEVADPKNTLHLYGTITATLPVSAQLEAQLTPTDLRLPAQVNATQTTHPIAEARLFEPDLRQLVNGITIRIPIVLQRYYPERDFDTSTSYPITIDLRLIKRGGLKLNL